MSFEASLVRFALLASVSGCSSLASGGPAATGRHDEPAPPGAPRAELVLVVDLEPAADCEERFDLALYRDRVVERVEWDVRRGACSSRRVAVRYLSESRRAEELVALIRGLVRRVEPSKENAR
ncbi:MAG: hypothetical protein FJ095_12325 [Deltaproteobacteria bacterium]|nr:hypothetical protein [Deltaproteobacteria bacterium]